MSRESYPVIISYGIVPLPVDKYSDTHFWSSLEHKLNFLAKFSSFLMNFLHSFQITNFSFSVKLLASDPKLC